MSVADAARAGVREAARWHHTGQPPDRPARVPYPTLEGKPLPPGFRKQMALRPGRLAFDPTMHPKAPKGGITIGGQYFRGGRPVVP